MDGNRHLKGRREESWRDQAVVAGQWRRGWNTYSLYQNLKFQHDVFVVLANTARCFFSVHFGCEEAIFALRLADCACMF